MPDITDKGPNDEEVPKNGEWPKLPTKKTVDSLPDTETRPTDARPGPSAVEPRPRSVEIPQTNAGTKQPRIPPIVLRQREMWSALLQHMRALTIKFREAKSISPAIQIIPERIEDYRAIVGYLGKKRWAYHT